MALIAEYGFNEGTGSTAASTGSGPNLTVTGSWDAGHTGGGISASNGSAGSVIPFATTASSWTIMCWAKFTEASTGDESMIQYGDFSSDSSGTPVIYLEYGGMVDGYIRTGMGEEVTVNGYAVNVGEWHHFALSFDDASRSLTLYEDGNVYSSTQPGTAHYDLAGQTFYVGGSPDQPSSMIIDDVRFFDTALDQPAIQTWMSTPVSSGTSDESSNPTIMVGGIETGVHWSVMKNGVETPVTSWSIMKNGVETPLADPSATTHTVFGDQAPSYTLAVYADGAPNITVGNYFYAYGDSSVNWQCVGGRVYVPNDPNLVGKNITIEAWYLGGWAVDLTTAPLRSVQTTVPATGGWTAVSWSGFAIPVGSVAFIGYTFEASVDDYYIAASGASVGSNFVTASDGASIVLAESTMSQPFAAQRGAYLMGTSTSGGTANWYGTDIVADTA